MYYNDTLSTQFYMENCVLNKYFHKYKISLYLSLRWFGTYFVYLTYFERHQYSSQLHLDYDQHHHNVDIHPGMRKYSIRIIYNKNHQKIYFDRLGNNDSCKSVEILRLFCSILQRNRLKCDHFSNLKGKLIQVLI